MLIEIPMYPDPEMLRDGASYNYSSSICKNIIGP
jgi:hypothetical protein